MNRFTSKKVELAPGVSLTIREPNPIEDLEDIMEFFRRLPDSCRQMLRFRSDDLIDLRSLLDRLDGEGHWRLIAVKNHMIVGDATMDREPFSWTHHIAHIRTIVPPSEDTFGIEDLLFGNLLDLATRAGIERISTEVLPDDQRRLQFLEKRGFIHEFTRHKSAKVRGGRLSDILTLSTDLDSAWQRLSDHIHQLDIPLPGAFEHL